MTETQAQAQLKQLYSTLQIEKKDDLQNYQQMVLKASLQSQKENGFTWYPIIIRNTEIGIGDYYTIEIEKSVPDHKAHQFQTGKSIEIFQMNGTERNSMKGVIKAMVKSKMIISTTIDDLPDWFDEGRLGVSLMFDEYTYTEMEHSMKRVIQAQNNRLSELREILYNPSLARFSEKKFHLSNHPLNEVQQHAIEKCLQAEDVAIIHGPPGTGKTTTLVALISELLKTEKKILVCSPSNIAIDILTEKISHKNINVLRLGNPTRVSENILSKTLDGKVAAHPQYKDLKNYRKTAAEYKNMAHKYKRNFGKDEREQRNLLFAEARKLQAEARMLEEFIVKDQFNSAQVICCTLVGAANYALKNISFDTVLIDEAAQALEPACWIPIEKGKRVIFAGDHLQLPPTVKSNEAVKAGLAISLMEKCIHENNSVMLEVQYRMNEDIMQFSNLHFYHDKLKAHDSVAHRTLLTHNELIASTAFDFIDTAGCGYEEELNPESVSVCNKDEAALLIKHMKKLFEELIENKQSDIDFSVGIISPYKEQVQYITELLAEDEYLKLHHNIKVKTVDGFQGQEKDIIYISLVRSNDRGEIGFLSDTRRMNVALTRAKKKMVVIGDSATISSNDFYENFVSFTQENGFYKSAWEFIYE